MLYFMKDFHTKGKEKNKKEKISEICMQVNSGSSLTTKIIPPFSGAHVLFSQTLNELCGEECILQHDISTPLMSMLVNNEIVKALKDLLYLSH